ncbi:MAG: hypothetical protein KKC46_00320 [Proteobacteria bacterium]|nr:hypothetical protein [Pseudomonadota bacterium]
MTISIFNKKIILFDGISGVPLGKEMHEAFVQSGFAADYIDNTQLIKNHTTNYYPRPVKYCTELCCLSFFFSSRHMNILGI